MSNIKQAKIEYASLFDDIYREKKEDFKASEFSAVLIEVGELLKWDPRELPSALWGNNNWEYVDCKVREHFLGNLLITQLGRVRFTPVYEAIGSTLLKMKHEEFKGLGAMDILSRLPILRKDSVKGDGFRFKAHKDENVMKPRIPGIEDFQWTKWFSGGTKGDPTPTFLLNKDLEAEAYALGRGFRQGGFRKEDRLFTTYNLAHKGGRLIVDACRLLGMDVYTNNDMAKAGMEFNLENVLRFMRNKKVNVIATVQPFDIGEGDVTKKGTGVTFLGLYERDKDLFGEKGQVKKAFITGYWLLPGMINECEKASIELFTIDGASEVLPIAGSTYEAVKKGWPCKYNTLHLHQGPHYTLVIDKNLARDNMIVPLEKEGERGIVLHSTIGRGYGTLLLNYQIGDFATSGHVKNGVKCVCGKTTPVMIDVQRQDRPIQDVLGAGCVSDV